MDTLVYEGESADFGNVFNMRRCATITHESVTSPKTFQLTMHAAKSAASLALSSLWRQPCARVIPNKALGGDF